MLTISQDIIFHKLGEHFDVSFIHRSDHLVQVGGPRCFTATQDDLGHAVIVSAGDREAFVQWTRANMTEAAHANRREKYDSRSASEPDAETAFSYESGTLYILMEPAEGLSVPPIPGMSLIELKDASLGQAVNAISNIFQSFADWHEALKAAEDADDVFKCIVDTCDDILGSPLSIVDEEFVYVAYSDSSITEGLVESSDGIDVGVPEYILREYYSSPEFKHITERHEVFSQSFTFGDSVLRNLFYEDRYIGRIGMRLDPYNEELFRFYAAMLNCLAPVIERAYARHRSFITADEPLASTRQVVARCLAGQPVTLQERETSLALLGWARGDELLLIQLLPNLRYDSNPYPKRTIPFIEERWRGCLGFHHLDKLFVLVNLDCFEADQGEGLDQALSYLVRDELMTAGLSNSFYSLADLREAFVQTEVALAVGATDDSLRWTFRFDDCAVLYLLMNSVGDFADDALALVSRKVRILAAHDTDKGTDYYHTLREYLRCHMNASETARALFIHRSSFLSRMERINALVDLHLESPLEVLYLSWSFYLMDSLRRQD